MAFTRATSMADAFMTATAKQIKAGKVDADKGQGHWVARRCIIDATQDRHIGMVKEVEHRPVPPHLRVALHEGEGSGDLD